MDMKRRFRCILYRYFEPGLASEYLEGTHLNVVKSGLLSPQHNESISNNQTR
jgi:hypothetical protein